MRTTCRSGNSDAIDKLLATIEANRANRREARKDTPFTKAANLRFAPPSPPTTIGSDIRSALEYAGHYCRLTGQCRSYLSHLNKTQRHDAVAITDRLADLLKEESVQNVRRKQTLPVDREWLAGIVGQVIQAEVDSRPGKKSGKVPSVSDVGTRLQIAIEAECDYKMTCGPCLSFLNSLNQTTIHDSEAITDKLMTIDFPIEKLRAVGSMKDRRIWLRSIVESVIDAK